MEVGSKLSTCPGRGQTGSRPCGSPVSLRLWRQCKRFSQSSQVDVDSRTSSCATVALVTAVPPENSIRRARFVFPGPAQHTPATILPLDRSPKGGVDVCSARHLPHSAWLAPEPGRAGEGLAGSATGGADLEGQGRRHPSGAGAPSSVLPRRLITPPHLEQPGSRSSLSSVVVGCARPIYQLNGRSYATTAACGPPHGHLQCRRGLDGRGARPAYALFPCRSLRGSRPVPWLPC